MKKLALLNVIWCGVAAGAFFLGGKVLGPQSGDGADSSAAAGPQANPRFLDGLDAGGSVSGQPGQEDAASTAPAGLAGLSENIPDWMKQKGPLSPEQMEQAVREVATMSNPVERNALMSALVERLTPENADAAFRTLRAESTGFEAGQSLGLLAYAWGSMDGAAALKAIAESGDRGAQFFGASAVAGWAAGDPEAAMAWVAENGPEGIGARFLEGGLVRGLAMSDPDMATKYVAGLETDENKDWMMRSIAEEQMKRGIEGAAKWAENLPEDMRWAAVTQVAEGLARRDLDSATSWVQEMAGQEGSGDAVGRVAETMAQQNAESAVAWVDGLPDGEAKSRGYQEVFEVWARSDPNAAGAYLDAMPPSESRDYALSEFTDEIAREDAAVAVQWAMTIGSDELRVNSMVRAAQNWYQSDPDAAGRWAAENLPAERQPEVLQEPRRGGPPWRN